MTFVCLSSCTSIKSVFEAWNTQRTNVWMSVRSKFILYKMNPYSEIKHQFFQLLHYNINMKVIISKTFHSMLQFKFKNQVHIAGHSKNIKFVDHFRPPPPPLCQSVIFKTPNKYVSKTLTSHDVKRYWFKSENFFKLNLKKICVQKALCI